MAPDDDDTDPLPLADGELWRRVAGSVRPLPQRDRGSRGSQLSKPQRLPADTPDAPQSQSPSESEPEPERRSAQGARSPVPAPEAFLTLSLRERGPQDLHHGAASGLDKRSLARLRRGMLPIEGTIDLHGMTQAEAHMALHQFIAGSQQRGRRCVLVITGKGSRSEGVLRSAVPHWLNLPANRSLVLAFAYATPAHGGAGALYVLLKRRRS